MSDTLLVNEIFGPTWQGEGPSVGKLCYFLRTAICNQKCIFCDTFYTWAFKESDIVNHLYAKTPARFEDEVHKMNYSQIIDKLLTLSHAYNNSIEFLVISGGEPMLQSKKILELLGRIDVKKVEIETAGVVFDKDLSKLKNVYFNVSPKLENSGNSKFIRYKDDVLVDFNYSSKSIFKFVVCDKKDFLEVDEIVEDIGIHSHKVYIMIEGITKEAQDEGMKKFVPWVLERGWNYTPRLHVQLFGNKRGT